MITDNDIKRLIKNLATKKDIESLEERLKSFEKRTDRRFDQVDVKLATHDRRFDQVDVKLDLLDEKADGVLEYAEGIEEERDKNEKRLKRIEIKLNLPSV